MSIQPVPLPSDPAPPPVPGASRRPEAPPETAERRVSPGAAAADDAVIITSPREVLPPRRRPRRPRGVPRAPELAVAQILAWADAHRERTGAWPGKQSGRIPEAPGDTWAQIDGALGKGFRGLEGGSSLCQLLAQHRGLRNPQALPPLTEAQILAWADAHHARTGAWPNRDAGPVCAAPDEKWSGVQAALMAGGRGLPGGTSLAKLLAAERGVPYLPDRPPFTPEQILTWADAYHQRTGQWPNYDTGDIAEAPGENWRAVHNALRLGLRGLPGGISLAQFFARERGARNRMDLPPLCLDAVLAWADAYHARTGRWPTPTTEPIPEAPGETWCAVNGALLEARRGLPGPTSLVRLLTEHRERPWHTPPPRRPELGVAQILAWADAHYARHVEWPVADSGPIPEAPEETWNAVHLALLRGRRGLRGGQSLHAFLVARRQKLEPAPLTEAQILQWADRYHERHGTWPTENSGNIADAPEESWQRVNRALKRGLRGLPGDSSLARLLVADRDKRSRIALPPLTIAAILAWADAYRTRTGAWPRKDTGPVAEAPGETWSAVDAALRNGARGLPGGSSLPLLLAEQRGKRNHLAAPRLCAERILQWADAYHDRHGCYPNLYSGPIPESPGDTWGRIYTALQQGGRGLAGGSTLPRLLAEHGRGPLARPPAGRAEPLPRSTPAPPVPPEPPRSVRSAAPRVPPDDPAVAPPPPLGSARAPSPPTTERQLSPHLAARRPRSLAT